MWRESLNLRSASWEAWYIIWWRLWVPQRLNQQRQQKLFFFTAWFINADWTEPTSLPSFHTIINKCIHLKPQICLLSPFSRFLYLLKLIFQLPQLQGGWEFNATPSMPPPLALFPALMLGTTFFKTWHFRVCLSLFLSYSLSFFLYLFVFYINIIQQSCFFSIHRSLSLPS